LKAHHVVLWILGGTDLDIWSLCQWHHTAVHEGGVTITADADDGWIFHKPDGRLCDSWVDDDNLARHLAFALRRNPAQQDQLAEVDSFDHPRREPSDPAGQVNPSICMPACKPVHHQTPAPKSDLDQQAA
jgi:hypothetical protein